LEKEQELARLELQRVGESIEIDLGWLVQWLTAICLRLLEDITMPLRRGL
jgi:hypothetical protein